jgi:uncharacterized membrane protein YhaH (DUF805 family)
VVSRAEGLFAAALLVVGALGVAGNVGYGFDTIHVSLGGTALVDAPGAANLIKPLGLCFPLTLLMCAVALRRLAPVRVSAAIAVGALIFPVAHIADIKWLAVLDNVVLAAGFVAVALLEARSPAARGTRPVREAAS